MKGQGNEIPPMVSRFGMGGFVPIKHLAISVIITFLIFAFMILYSWMTFLPQMEEASEETSELIGGSGGGESISIIEGDAINAIRLVYLLSLIIFGLLDGIFAFMLWRAKPPIKNEKILSPLYAIYIVHRLIALFTIFQLSVFVLVSSNSRPLLNLLYLTIPVFSAVSLVIILLVHRKVLGEKMEDEVVFKVPDETAL